MKREPTNQAVFERLADEVDLFKSKIDIALNDAGCPVREELTSARKTLEELKSNLDE